MKYFIFKLFIVILTFTSCQQNKLSNNRLKILQIETQNCLDSFQNCSGLIEEIKTYDDDLSLFLLGEWYARIGNYQLADSLFVRIKDKYFDLPIQSKAFQQFFIALIKNQNYSENYSIALENEVLNKIDWNDSNQLSFAVAILLQKSSKLCEQNRIKHSFCTDLYALYLKEKFNVSVSSTSLPEFFHGISLFREGKNEQSKYFIGISSLKCDDLSKPICRKIKCINSSLFKESEKLDIEFYKELLNHDQYTPMLDQFIETQLNFASSDSASTRLFQEKLNSEGEFCTTNFYNTIYLIDDLISQRQLKEANKYLNYLRDCKEGANEYLVLCRDQKYHLAAYNQYCNPDFLDQFLLISMKTKEFSLRRFQNTNTIHYADFIFGNNSSMIEAIYDIVNSEKGKLSKNQIIFELIDAKEIIQKISSTTSIFNKKKVPHEMMTRYANIQNHIDILEKDVHEYTDTIFQDLSIYKKLYHLYEDQYRLEQSIKKLPTRAVEDEKLTFDELSLYLDQSNSQIIDILATEDNYFFSFIHSDTIIIEKYDRESVNGWIENSLDDIKTQRIIGNKNYSNQRLFSLIQPFLDKKRQNIIIIPDQKFTEYPFDQLVTSSVNDMDTYFLGDRYNISYNFNINKIIPKTTEKQYIDNDCALFSYSSRSTISNRVKKEITELPLALEEIEKISNIKPSSKIYVGEEMSKENIYNSLGASIIHISSHSNSNPENLLDNFFYVRDHNGKPDKMYGFEIKNHKLDHNLVILSSCNSGTGAYKPGAGTFSISRDFLQAGAQSVIKSLWAVNEASTSELMFHFHEFFNKGYTASMALTLAKRQQKQSRKFAHPYFWAGFELEGNPELRLKNQ